MGSFLECPLYEKKTKYVVYLSLAFFLGMAMTEMTSTASLNVEKSLQQQPQPRRPWRLKPTVRRQARLDLDVPAQALAQVQQQPPSVSPSRDHGLRTPPGPPVTTTSGSSPLISRPRRPTTLEDNNEEHHQVLRSQQHSHRHHATHLMASDISGLLVPPSRSSALNRAHTDPSSTNYEVFVPQEATPNSPPPTYEEVMKQVGGSFMQYITYLHVEIILNRFLYYYDGKMMLVSPN